MEQINITSLTIRTLGSGFQLLYSDSVFNGSTLYVSKNEFEEFCKKKADDFRNSELGNYTDVPKAKREFLAKKWEEVINLKAGTYPGYFNKQAKELLFKKAVKEIAKEYNIKKYKLEVN